MGTTKPWFAVDRAGLAKIVQRKGIEFVVFELIQNAWDTKATEAHVFLNRDPHTHFVRLSVEDDDPDGFADMTHAYTLFAESVKKAVPTLRGRFNLGEKLVLALARSAVISSTKGTVRFDEDGRHTSPLKMGRGSRIEVELRMTHAEEKRLREKVLTLIPPAEVKTTFDGDEIVHRKPLAEVELTLDTEVADADGYLRKSPRKTEVRVFEVLPGEVGSIYEMGIPVVETGDRWHYDVGQKVPVNFDRDNVPPAYLRTIRVGVLNALHAETTPEDCNQTWVRDALADPRVATEAVKDAVTKRFGKKVVTYDPSDPEANARAFAEGFTVVKGNQLSKAEWENLRRAEVAPPAGQVTPSAKPYAEGGKPHNYIPEEKWTDGMKGAAMEAERVAYHVLGGKRITVAWVLEGLEWNFRATYGGGSLILNKRLIAKNLYEPVISDEFYALLIHEFGHEYESDHLSESYYRALCRLGARMRTLDTET